MSKVAGGFDPHTDLYSNTARPQMGMKMGVDQTHYVMYGVKIAPGHPRWHSIYSDDDLLDREDIDVVSDGMCGEYVVFGKILASGGVCDGLNFTEVVPPTGTELGRVNAVIRQLLGESPDQPSLYAFTHFH